MRVREELGNYVCIIQFWLLSSCSFLFYYNVFRNLELKLRIYIYIFAYINAWYIFSYRQNNQYIYIYIQQVIIQSRSSPYPKYSSYNMNSIFLNHLRIFLCPYHNLAALFQWLLCQARSLSLIGTGNRAITSMADSVMQSDLGPILQAFYKR